MKKFQFCLPFLCLALITASTRADQLPINIGQESGGVQKVLYDDMFFLPETTSINFISIELAATFGQDLLIELTAPDSTVYTLMNREVDTNGINGDFDMGASAGNGSLSNLAEYIFVADAGAVGGNTVWAVTFNGAGTYDANISNNGANGFPAGANAAGNWRLYVEDLQAFDSAAAGQFIIDYTTAVPEPGSAMLLLGGFGLVALRRRRS